STDGCGVVTNSKILTIQPQPIANAGNDATRCANNAVVDLAGVVSNGSTTGIWTSSGSGSFNAPTALNAIYTASANDVANGPITLTLSSTNNGVCGAGTDVMVLNFTAAPIVNANADQTICTNDPIAQLNGSVTAGSSTGMWSTIGSGTFSSPIALNSTYTASAADITSGSVTLTLTSTDHGNCITVTDQMAISFSGAPVVNAGPDVSVCMNNPATNLNGSVTAGATTGAWATAGDGTFTNANALITTYNPGAYDLANGSVLVTLSATNFGNCIVVSDSKLITFGNGPVVLAGIDQVMCANNVVQLGGSVSGSTTTGIWSTSGNGSFQPSNTTLNAVYHPSAADTTSGSVILTLTSTNNGTCNVEDDAMQVEFTPAPIVNAGANQMLCANSPVAALNGSVIAGSISGIWSSNGSGSFSPNASALNATYTASASDISAGSVILTLTSTDHGNCVAVFDAMSITITAAPVVNAGNNVSLCINNTMATLNGSVSGGATTGLWTTSGDGIFINANALNTTYDPGTNDLANGSVIVTLTATNFGNCISVSDDKLISFGNGPLVLAGDDQVMCANNVVQLNGAVSG
ncbi:MAG: gliding motility-associated C-terminal domain-containing protein, partial [Bacteroidota bacterium]|nr:gliding motility-associated C-terminal domain-containing protein [Bacteroidota bacterium]